MKILLIILLLTTMSYAYATVGYSVLELDSERTEDYQGQTQICVRLWVELKQSYYNKRIIATALLDDDADLKLKITGKDLDKINSTRIVEIEKIILSDDINCSRIFD